MDDGDAIVFDPEVGEDVRKTLTRLAASGRLPPYRQAAPAPAASGKNRATPVGCGIGGIGLAAGLAVLGTSVQWSLNIVIPVSLCGAAVGRETAADALAGLNAIHAELLAGVGETEADSGLTERVRDEAQAVIDQAQASARRALDSGEKEGQQDAG
jgi:hypothetical protein